MNVTYRPRKWGEKGRALSFVFSVSTLTYSTFFLQAVATKSITMTEDSALFNKETVQFYREYTGVKNVHDLENHLMAIQQKLAKVCISGGRDPEKNKSMRLIEFNH